MRIKLKRRTDKTVIFRIASFCGKQKTGNWQKTTLTRERGTQTTDHHKGTNNKERALDPETPKSLFLASMGFLRILTPIPWQNTLFTICKTTHLIINSLNFIHQAFWSHGLQVILFKSDTLMIQGLQWKDQISQSSVSPSCWQTEKVVQGNSKQRKDFEKARQCSLTKLM